LPFELFIALRYLLARRRQAFISLISLISTRGVTGGVMALILALALMTGLQGELRDRLLGATGHIYVWKTAAGGISDYQAEVTKLRAVPGVIGAAPAVDDKALISSESSSQFISVKGISPKLERTVTDLATGMTEGRLESLDAGPDADFPNILLGADLARALDVKVGDRVRLVAPSGTLTPMGMAPVSRPARVGGIYKLGIYEFDSAYGFVALDFAKRLTGVEAVEMIQVRVDDIYEAPAVAARIQDTLGDGYVAQDWALFGARAREDRHLHHHWPHRDRRGAQYHRVAHPARDGEEPRHRDSEDHGDVVSTRDEDLHAPGARDRLRGHDVRSDRRASVVLGARSLPADSDPR
jgi:lipoprotein-releasing system permease protein